jgi:hypothetical protein
MEKWEYTSVVIVKGQQDAGSASEVALLNEYGSEGWKLVVVVPYGDGLVAYFKRRVEGHQASTKRHDVMPHGSFVE